MKTPFARDILLASALAVGIANATEMATAPTAELIQTLKNSKDGGLPRTFSTGRGFEVIGDYLYLSGYSGGVIQYFKRDRQTGTITYVDGVTDTAIKATVSLRAVGGRLYALGLFVWGAQDGDKCKGLSWYDIEPGTGKPVQKGTLPEIASSGWNQQLVAGPEGKDLYGFFETPAGKKLTWLKIGADGTPTKGGETAGAGLSEVLGISPDGKHLYSIGDHRIAIVERKPTGEVAYKNALPLDCLVSSRAPSAESLADLRPTLAGISPDGTWLYVVLFSEQIRTRSYFGIFKRDPATGDLALQEGGASSTPEYSRFANLPDMNLIFMPDGKGGYIANGKCLLQTFQLDATSGRLRGITDLVLGKPEEIKCRPGQSVLFDSQNGFLYGTGVWQTGAYGEHWRGLWVAKTGTAKVQDGERLDIKSTVANAPEAKPASEADWPCWRGPNGDGKNPLTGIRKDWTGGLRKVWEVSGLSPGDVTWSAPSVRGDKLIVLGTHGFVDEVFCFDADKGGRPLWITELAGGGDSSKQGGRDGWCGGPVATPCINGDKVYVSQGQRLLCLRLTDGEVLWKKNVVSACHVYAASPLVWDDLLIVPGLSQPNEKPFLLAGLKKDTGDLVWRYGVGAPHSGDSPTFGHVSPLRMKINGVEQVVYNTGALACGLDYRTGQPYWEHKFEMRGSNVNAAEPVTDGAILAVMLGDGEGRPFAVQIENNATVKPLWGKLPNYRAMWSDPILKDGYIYMFSADGLYSGPNSEFLCLDLQTGQPKWIEKKTGCGSMLEVDGCLLCLTYTGDLWLVAPSPDGFKKITEWKGAIKPEPWWTSNGGKGPAPCWTIPVIARGKLYLRYSNTLACYDLIK